MREKLRPYKLIDSVYGFDFKGLYDEGFRGLIFDIDNTLVGDNAPADERSRNLIGRLSAMGFSCLVLSNNGIGRVKSFADKVGCAYLFKAAKPKKDGYLTAMKMIGTGPEDTACFGDQLFTDVLGANNAGLRIYLCRPLDPDHERFKIRFKRFFERLFIRR
ncbi:MAG: HAD hydrolase-like protein [Lachnospiraceae bacterium]|nr:HAD hydrolase-like protein [Lachnospiraceae bacterium]